MKIWPCNEKKSAVFDFFKCQNDVYHTQFLEGQRHLHGGGIDESEE
jgi:hypothetical protein